MVMSLLVVATSRSSARWSSLAAVDLLLGDFFLLVFGSVSVPIFVVAQGVSSTTGKP